MKKRVLTPRDYNILKLIWKWKIVSTSYIKLMFFQKQSVHTAYLRLQKLRASKFLYIKYSEDGAEKMWGLTRKGFLAIKSYLPLHKMDGFRTESMKHDIRSQIIQLGVFDGIESKNLSILTEQELRCFHESILPHQLRGASRRSDGYWIINNENIIALENEISEKSAAEYCKIGYFYDANDDIKCIIWVVDKTAIATRIYHQMHRVSPENYLKHSCVLYDDFIKNGVNCEVISGKFKSKKLIELFLYFGAARVRKNSEHSLTQQLLKKNISC